jgi:hypothetical protein
MCLPLRWQPDGPRVYLAEIQAQQPPRAETIGAGGAHGRCALWWCAGRGRAGPGRGSRYLFQDPVSQVGDAVGLHHLRAFQGELLPVEIVQQADAAEYDAHDAEAYLIEQAGLHRALWMPPVTAVPPVPGPVQRAGGLWVRTKKGQPSGW